MKASLAAAVTLLIQVHAAFAQAPANNGQKLTYPATPRADVTEQHFGQTVTDLYRWLENDAVADPAVVAWVVSQRKVTQNYLDTLPGRDLLRKRMKELSTYDRHTVPKKRGNRYFFNLIKGEANQAALYVRDGVAGDSRALIDPNSWSDDGADALDGWNVSDDGRHVAFGVRKGGSDWLTIEVLDVDSGKAFDDRIEGARFTRLAWAPDGSGFFYSRMPRPENGSAAGSVFKNHAVHFHKLGTPQADDRLIYSTPDRPELLHGADRVSGGRYLTIASTPGTNESALTVIDLASSDWKPRTVVADMQSAWSVLGDDGSKLILATTYGAGRGRIVSLGLAEADPKPQEIVAEADGKAVLDGAIFAGDTLLASYQVDVRTELRRFTKDGKPDGTVKLPGIGTAHFAEGNAHEKEAFFGFTSYDAPISVYRYDIEARDVTPWAVPQVPIDLSNITVEQRFYRSRDGTEVPLSTVRRKDVAGAAPTLLYSYGGFGISQIPIYNPLQLAWVEQGGVLAIANIRGGGEYGREWHRAGQLEKRQNAFDDFIAAADF